MLLAALLLGDYGRSLWMMERGTQPGWKTERWQAGFGSWARGGYGVAYDISMPKDYSFQQKCGSAWIGDDFDGTDFDIRFTYSPQERDRRADFALYRHEDLGHGYEIDASSVKMDAPSPLIFGKIRFDRTNLIVDEVKTRVEDADEAAPPGPAKGFWLSGEGLSIIADLRDPAGAAVNERIVASIRKANGYGLTELIFGTVPGLLGC
jgi:hypothetical protein